MLIEEKTLKHWIDHFYGYGSWHAEFWFIAHEEGGGDLPEEVADKLNYFYRLHQQPEGSLCDIRDLYKSTAVRWDGRKANAYRNLYEYRFGENAIQHGVWKNLIAFVHGYRNESLPDLLAYQKQTFASPAALNEALLRLYPLPSPHNHAWYYSWLDLPESGFLKTRALYQDHLYDQRIHHLLSNISAYKPKVVLMYGMTNINMLKKTVQKFFNGVNFRTVKAIKQQIPQHHRADVNGTTILITTQIPTLRHNRIETGFDWEQFGKSSQ